MTDIVQKMRDDADQLYACDPNLWLMDTINHLRDGADEIERLRAALAAEREACAKVADKFSKDYPAQDACADIAAAIRARGET